MNNDQLIKVCDQAGVRFDGIQHVSGGNDGEQLVLFTDLLTKSTLALQKKDFNSQKLQAKVTKHRKSYPKDLEMAAYFVDAMDFIVRKYHVVPKNVITEAAHNAAITIQKFVNEEKNNAISKT